jgi:hypothetical protein
MEDEILPIVEGKIDKGWLQSTVSLAPPIGAPAKAVRAPRLALAF